MQLKTDHAINPPITPLMPPAAPLATGLVALLSVALLAFVVIGFVDPALYDDLSRKDNIESTGLIEHLTVIFLVPGITAAIFTLVHFRKYFPSRKHALWLLMWTLACTYFAGEECSWGQWYFDFGTPDTLAEINRQEEFNIHNTTSWFNQKPQFLVEMFIIFAGFLLPVYARFRPDSAVARHPWSPWILAMPMCWSAAAYFMLVRSIYLIHTDTFHPIDAELREMAVAGFLTTYLISYAVRFLRPMAAPAPTRD